MSVRDLATSGQFEVNAVEPTALDALKDAVFQKPRHFEGDLLTFVIDRELLT